MELKDKPSPIERFMKKRFEEMSPSQLRRIRIISSLFFATAVTLTGALLDYCANPYMAIKKYILVWLVSFSGWYILIPVISKGKISKPNKMTKIFFILIGCVAILGAILRIVYLLGLYIQNRPLLSRDTVYSINFWAIVINFIILLVLIVGIGYILKIMNKINK